MKMSSIALCLVASFKCNLTFASEENSDKMFELSIEELLEVEIISASKIKQIPSKAPATIRVITAKQIIQRGYQTLDEVLRDVPGIDLINVGGAYPYIYTIRGSYGDENRRLLLMIDGIVENALNGSFEMAGPVYSLHNIERIEVIYGPASALYGANAYSGMINMITKHGERHRGTVAATSVGSFNSKTAKLYSNHGTDTDLGKIDFSLSANWFDTNGERYSNRHPDYSANFVDNAYSIVSRLSIKHGRQQASLGFNVFDTPMGNGTFGNANTQFFGLPMASEANPGSGGFIQHDIGGQYPGLWHPVSKTVFFQYDYQLNDALSLSTRTQYRETGIRDDSYSYSRSADNFFKFTAQHENHGYGIQIQATYKLSEKRHLIAGSQYNNDNLERGYRGLLTDTDITAIDGIPIINVNGSYLPRKGVSSINRGYFVQYVHPTQWFGETDFTLGLRYDENTLYGSSITPRIGATNRVDDNLSFKLLYGRAFRAPTPFELFASSPVRLENPNLEPETVDTFEFSGAYQQDNIQLIATTFYSDMSKVIVTGISVGGGKTQIQNVGTGIIKGLELEALYYHSEDWQIFANFSYQDASQNLGQGKTDIPNIAKYKGNINVNYQFHQHYNLNASLNWVDNRKTQQSNPLPQVDGYTSSNIVLTRADFLSKNLTLQLKIKNLFDEAYVDPGIRGADGIQWGTVHEQPGRHFLATLSYEF